MAAKTRTRIRRRIAVMISVALIGTLLQGALTPAAQADDMPKVPASEKPLSGHGVKMLPRVTKGAPGIPRQAPKPVWPKAASATVTLQPGAGTAAVRAGSTPVSLTAPAAPKGARTPVAPLTGAAMVQVLDHQAARRAGVDGMLFSLQRRSATTGDRVRIGIDYSAFAQSYGASYASRVKLVRLPACAATTPGKKGCTTPSAITTRNDLSTQTLTADSVTVPASSQSSLFALTAGTSSDRGDYAATSLSPSAAWNTDLNAGDFSWSYDMPVPGTPGKFAPSVSMSYSSGAIDGRTSNTNNQSSWAGDGFNLWSGSIERAYKPCADDGVKNADGRKPGDLCWAYDNASISFNGHAGELIPTGADTFKIRGDDGTKVDRLRGTATDVRANGARNDEYWRVTTTDGTRYYFGYNRLEGWASGNPTTNSTWTVPVFGNDTGEPCHAATFAESWCQQAWRWNLDYAVDARGNSIGYFYNKETNTYARNLKPEDETSYDRGGSLDHIDYGLRNTTNYSAKALARVDFTSTERCLPETGVTCDASTIDSKAFYWYDTPWDLNCASGADCTKSASPTFWTRKRLTDVTTQVLKPDSSGYTPIDTWHLDHGWGMADIDYQLLLKSIQHTGKSTTPNITLPKVTFGYDQRANRLDTLGDGTAPFIKERLSQVVDESGGQLNVGYSDAACDPAHLPAPESNTTRCYPVYFTKQGDENPSLQWFNKYVVDSVTQTDRTKTSPDMVTRYSYLDGAAWHYDDDDGLTKQKYKTWSTWRGYGHVREQTGGQDPVGMKSQTDHYFLRGMDGDKSKPDPVTVPDGNGGTITDHDSAAGFEYKTEQYSGPAGKVLIRTVNTPWHHETAKRVRDWGTTTANLTGTAGTRTWTSLDDGAGSRWRKTHSANTFENTAGRITRTDDFGDESISRDDQCTRITYADNTTAWILTTTARVETVAVACDTMPNRAKDVIADVRTAYDGQAYGTPPIRGDASRTATLKSHDGTTATYTEAGATFDTATGRTSTVTDITGTVTATETTAPVRTDRTDGRTTTTAYSPTSGFPTNVTVTSPPATPGTPATSQTTTTTYDTLRGLPVTVLDTNNRRTDTTYDALGRKLKVWLPNRSKANNDIPNYEFSYTITDKNAVAVATKTLKSDSAQQTAYTVYDGFLRPRQSQTPGPDGGRLVSDTFYDERGMTAKSFAPYYNTLAPSADPLILDDALAVETQTWNTYDGLGRVTKSQQVAGNGDGGSVLATTRTDYGGDRTIVTPPQGATPTTTVFDARGNTTDLLQYDANAPGRAPDTTHYDYTPAGRLAGLTDPSGNTWTYTYDQRGNMTDVHDPDKGDSASGYDDRNLLTFTRDARQRTVTHVYDGLGRETETHDGEASGPLLTKHVWDPSSYEGQLASATRYIGGASGLAYTTTYNIYDTLYRPNRITTTIPSVTGEEALAGSYQSNIKYNANGTVQSTSYPAAGSLAADTLTPTYDATLRPVTLSGTGAVTYLTNTTYSYTGKPLQFTYQSGGKRTEATYTYQWGTQRLANARVDREDVPGVDKSSTYGYDEAGNVTSINDVSRDGTDNQCFQYDYLTRLTEAWAQPTPTCADKPSGSVLGGPAPYWLSYTYDLSGNRKTQTLHDKTGVAAKDVQQTYTYPDAKATRPHFLTQVDTVGPDGTSRSSYTPDDAGNTATRTINGNKQTLDWDVEGHLAKVTQDDGNGGTKTLASYIYDVDGNRLISRTATDTTLYLGATELTLTKGATKAKATRYYDLGGGNQAIRTDDNKLSFLIGDHHGTSELAITATDLAMQQRRSTPFGTPRGTTPTAWPGQKGFIGGTQDTTTGLTHLGAREYDPDTGRFLSVDPVMDTADPQQLNAYSYTENNPVTYSDPTGRTKCDINPELCNHKTSPTVEKEKADGAYRAEQKEQKEEKEVKKKQKEIKEAYDYLFAPAKCFGNGFSSSSKFDVCYTQAEIDADKSMLREMLSALGDATVVIPWAKCVATHDERACYITGEAISTLDIGPIAGGSVRFARALSRTERALCSFTPATRVLMKDGQAKPIGKIKPGDKVATADPKTGKRQGNRTVSAQLIHRDDDLIDLTIRDKNNKTAKIHTTAGHPFWDDTLRTWIPAGQLAIGHTLNTADGRHAQLLGIENRAGTAEMYNLTVEQLHTYYVLAGEMPILVHNAGGPGSPAKGDKGTQRLIAELEANGYMIRGTEISATAANGVNIRFDVVAEKDGALHLFDAKNGPRAMFTKPQGRKGGYASIEANGGTWYGPNAQAAGLQGSFGANEVRIAGYGGYKFSGLCR
ncbi:MULTISPECIES: RHS repeat-associated core domain-containing protein [unclassified Streptomyces]|uniref:RHS repeat-associated core domain-containing protein n=1 Tax=unclassified Streptomyces TaxID=2593676 RepID=UPI00081E07AD|nr:MULTISPECIES: RHS repeat-associated core domain-containing protein [unclassified Streptomyces]MYZ34164.1 sugar-binding protein [Streptomyces sp. SID4917]SCF64635.1 intein C-terminal splicing region/RHS repeat-associated core domain-containing protein [Streptomyces sp. MnatMP-M17]